MATPPTTNTPPNAARYPRVLSCLLCSQRKVKCDRKTPCSNCVKARQECISAASQPAKRRKKRFPEAELLARLRHYEDLLRKQGVNLDDVNEKINGLAIGEKANSSSPTADKITGFEGRLIVSGSSAGNSTYINNNLWTGLSDEFRDAEEVLHSSSDDEETDPTVLMSSYDVLYPNDGTALLFGPQSSKSSLMALHPESFHIFRLWQTFIDNVNPIIKVIHVPTAQKDLLSASDNLKGVSKGMEALMFAIYSMAILSLDDTQCLSIFGQERATLLAKYHSATQQALINASFLKSSSIMVLQALVLYLMSIRSQVDPRSFFSMTGLAVRSGQRMGLYKNTTNHLPPFQTEMRRRLWWQIIILDSRAAELCGTGASILEQYLDIPPPLNVNDSDLYPEMTNFPKEPTDGLTEMAVAILRCEVGSFLKDTAKLLNKKESSGYSGSWQGMASPKVPLEAKDKLINELEQRLEAKYVVHCDLRIPLHFMSAMMVRCMICKLRLVAHHPRLQANRGGLMPLEEQENLFKWSLAMIEYQNQILTCPETQCFLWNLNTNMPLDAYICLLSAVRITPEGELADRAWAQIEQILDRNKLMRSGLTSKQVGDEKEITVMDLWFFQNPNNTFHIALSNLLVRAWEVREDAMMKTSGTLPSQPKFIIQLRQTLAARKAKQTNGSPPPPAGTGKGLASQNSGNTAAAMNTTSVDTTNTNPNPERSSFFLLPTQTFSSDFPPPPYQSFSDPNTHSHQQSQSQSHPNANSTTIPAYYDSNVDNTRSNPIPPTNTTHNNNYDETRVEMGNMMDWAFWDQMMGVTAEDMASFEDDNAMFSQ